ncbi:MAG: flagellar basal body L-ring protein FlgH [Myxococcota bacterium]
MLRSNRADRLSRLLFGLSLLVLTSGCVETSWREGREPMDYEPVSAAPPPPPSAGSVWNGGTSGGSFLFFDEKAAAVGDLVTVVIVEQTSAEGDASTETDSQRTTSASLSSQVGLQTLVTTPFKGLMKVFGFDGSGPDGNDGSEINVLQSGMNSDFAGEGRTSRSGTFTGVITCRVVGLLPNGILHIRGRRSVVVNHEAQYIALEGLVRREDLSIENQVMSNAIAEMRLAYDGMGVIDDKQRPGWMSRVIDWIYPF